MYRIMAFCLIAWTATAQAGDCEWPLIEAQHRPGTYWHWMASAVDETDLTRELEAFRAAGLGGAHIIPIYGAKGYEDRYVEYLSPAWMSLLAHTVREADRLGMWVDMTTGTGWNFGGPNIPDEMANAVVHIAVEKGINQSLYTLPLAGKPLEAVMAFGDRGQTLDLASAIGPSGDLEWTPPQGAWTVIALWQAPSGVKVERAAPGGDSQHYDRIIQPIFSHSPGPP